MSYFCKAIEVKQNEAKIQTFSLQFDPENPFMKSISNVSVMIDNLAFGP